MAEGDGEGEGEGVRAEDEVSVDDNEGQATLDIPIRDELGQESDEVIQISLNDLPRIEELLGVLKAERADLKLWLQFAVEYYRQEKFKDFENILEEGCSPEVERFYAEDKETRIALLNAYAAYKIDLGRPKPGEVKQRKREKGKYLTEALDYLNRADRISNADDKTWVNKGVLQTVRGDLRQAERDFSMALELNPNNLLALLGIASVYFQAKKYRDAKEQYKLAIRAHPGCAASVRVSLGLCFYELGKPGRAQECFLRALELNPDEVDALVALAVMELGAASQIDDDMDDEEGQSSQLENKRTLLQRALQRLEKAYGLEPNNPMVLNHLANHFFMKDKDNEFDRMKNLATNAFKNTELETIKAESSYILGRLFHHRAEFTKAREFYSHALKFWPDFVLAEYAVAQMEMHTQEIINPKKKVKKEVILGGLNKVDEYLRRVIKECPNDRDSLFLQGYVRQKLGKRKEAREYWKRVTDVHQGDTEAWIEQALSLHKISEKDNPCRTLATAEKEHALRAYTKAILAFTQMDEPVPHELYCNTGVLKYSLNDFSGAREDFTKALRNTASDGADPVTPNNATLHYNLARVQEQIGEIDAAEATYKSIIAVLPEYTDCFLRLGCMAMDRGQLNEAEDYFQDASRNDSKNLKALVLQGNLKVEKGEKKLAREKFNRVVNKLNPHQAYARLFLANIDLEGAQTLRNKDGRSKCIQNANGVYEGILTRRSYNMYAANGIAALIGLKEEYRTQAKQIMERIKEVSDSYDMPEVWINLAHLSILDKQYDIAASLYEQCLKRFFSGSNTEVHNFIAHAYVLAKKPEQARVPLLCALQRNPGDLRLWFNLAVSQYASAVQYLAKASEDRQLSGVKKAMESIKHASNIFEWLSHAQTQVAQMADKTFLEAPHTPDGEPPEDEADAVLLKMAKESMEKLGLETVEDVLESNGDANTMVNGVKVCRTMKERAAKNSTFTKTTKARQSYQSCQKSLKKATEVAKYHRDKELRLQKKLEQANQKSKDAAEERRQKLLQEEEERRRKQEEIDRRAAEQQERNKQVALKLADKNEKTRASEQQRKSKKKSDKSAKGKAVKEKFIDDSSDDSSSSGSSSSSSSDSDSDNPADKDYSANATATAQKEAQSGGKDGEEKKKRKKLLRKGGDDDSDSSSDESTSKPETKKRKTDEGDAKQPAADEKNTSTDATATPEKAKAANGKAPASSSKRVIDSSDEED